MSAHALAASASWQRPSTATVSAHARATLLLAIVAGQRPVLDADGGGQLMLVGQVASTPAAPAEQRSISTGQLPVIGAGGGEEVLGQVPASARALGGGGGAGQLAVGGEVLVSAPAPGAVLLAICGGKRPTVGAGSAASWWWPPKTPVSAPALRAVPAIAARQPPPLGAGGSCW